MMDRSLDSDHISIKHPDSTETKEGGRSPPTVHEGCLGRVSFVLLCHSFIKDVSMLPG